MKNLLIITLSLCCLLSCKTTSLKIGQYDVGAFLAEGVKLWDVNSITIEQEIQFGENMSAILLGTRPLHKNVMLNQYVNEVGMWLAANSGHDEFSWKFGVIDSDAVNAFAAPGGFVFITYGMLTKLTSEAELAAVLAHEIVHVIEQHHLNAIKSSVTRGAITEAVFLSADAYQANTGADRDQRQYKAWAKKITGAAQDLYSKGLDRDDELQADSLGIRLLAKSGYDPFAFISNLQILASLDPHDSSLALLYKTHPSPDERLNSIEIQLKQLESFQGENLTQRFETQVLAIHE